MSSSDGGVFEAEASDQRVGANGDPLAGVLAAVEMADGRGTARVPEGWGQGRSTFGGLLAAIALRALRSVVPTGRPPRSLQVAFVAPVPLGDLDVEVEALRHGRSASQARVTLRQGGEVALVAFGSFGDLRASTLELAAPPAPALRAREDCFAPPPSPVYPEFVRRVEMLWSEGAPPYSGDGGRVTGGWCRFRGAAGAASAEHVVALFDAWPVPVLAQLATPAPASSLSWGVDLVADPEPGALAGWWPYRAEVDATAGGWAQVRARLWTPAGRLAAIGQQTVAVYG